MPTAFNKEVSAIKAIRDRHKEGSQSLLAKRIVKKDFNPDTQDFKDCVTANVPTRTYYSVYSVIRRYDTQKTRMPASAAA